MLPSRATSVRAGILFSNPHERGWSLFPWWRRRDLNPHSPGPKIHLSSKCLHDFAARSENCRTLRDEPPFLAGGFNGRSGAGHCLSLQVAECEAIGKGKGSTRCILMEQKRKSRATLPPAPLTWIISSTNLRSSKPLPSEKERESGHSLTFFRARKSEPIAIFATTPSLRMM